MTSPPPTTQLTRPCRWMADSDGIESGPRSSESRRRQGAYGGLPASWVFFRKCRDLNHTTRSSAVGRSTARGEASSDCTPLRLPATLERPPEEWRGPGSLFLRECGDHGTAAQPSRRHRDPSAELGEREGRGALGSPQPLKAPAAFSSPKAKRRGHYLATVTFTVMDGPSGRFIFAAIFKHSLR